MSGTVSVPKTGKLAPTMTRSVQLIKLRNLQSTRFYTWGILTGCDAPDITMPKELGRIEDLKMGAGPRKEQKTIYTGTSGTACQAEHIFADSSTHCFKQKKLPY